MTFKLLKITAEKINDDYSKFFRINDKACDLYSGLISTLQDKMVATPLLRSVN